MKKYLLMALIAMFTVTAQAQIVHSQSSRITRTKGAHTPSIFADLGIGAFTGDAESAGIDLGLRWSKMFNPNVGWDILKVSAQTSFKDFDKALDLQAKTGIRGVTPVVFGNSTLYGNFAAGVGYFVDPDELGFAWEVGAGVNLSQRCALGVVYNNNNYSKRGYNFKIGLVSLRFSYGF